MSIPLDRLYHFLESVCEVDIIIYRWLPHGSRKLSDLKSIRFVETENIFYRSITQNMICHDQEPLNYNLHSFDDFLQEVEKRVQNTILYQQQVGVPQSAWLSHKKLQTIIANSHFRCLLDRVSNIHDSILLCHSEKNSQELEKFEGNGFIGVYYWSHALIARDWFRYAEHDSALVPNFDNITSDFLVYNRAWSGTREYRLKLVELLLDAKITSHCNIKFNAVDSGNHYTAHSFVNPSLKITRQDIEHILPENTATSHYSADYETSDYASAGIEVVLETLFDDTRNHLTEKSLRPIACGRPFILVSTPGSLQYLKSYGFKTFDGLIDETYDKIIDPSERLQFIVNEMKRISQLDRTAKCKLWEELYKIAEENKKLFFSTQFHNSVVDEFKRNFKSSYDKSKTHITAKWYHLFTDSTHLGPNPIRDRELARRILEYAKQYNKDIKINL